MGLFPQQFIDDLKQHADIVVVIQDYVSLKKTGATYKGLCPFHGEKTPSFHVNRDKGFFHCFGCGAGGDVFKFLELRESVSFPDAVRMLAQRFGMTLPDLEQTDEQRANAAERESLLKVHDAAAIWFRQQLTSPSGARIRAQICRASRIQDGTSEALGLGFAPSGRSERRAVAAGILTVTADTRRPRRPARGWDSRRPISKPADDSNPARNRLGDRVRRPRSRSPTSSPST